MISISTILLLWFFNTYFSFIGPVAFCSVQNIVQSGHSYVRCLSPSLSGIPSQPYVWLRQEPAQSIY